MSAHTPDRPLQYCGRLFTAEQIARIRELLASDPRLNRFQLSRRICDEFQWLRPDGRPKEMSCRVALLRMQRDGLIRLPPPQRIDCNRRRQPRLTAASDPQEPLFLPAAALGQLLLVPVHTRPQSALWNQLIERFHYLKYQPLPGAQMRYLVFHDSHLLAALGFSAAAWKLAPRDRFIGWNPEQRQRNLQHVVNNSRFLILPWIKAPNLASRILALAAKRLPQHWHSRYGYQPWLLETFVQQDRFQGTSYRAANWIRVGQTQGRGKLDRTHCRPLPIKDIYLYPLHKHFRRHLCATHDSYSKPS